MSTKSQYLSHATFVVLFAPNKDIRYRVKEIEEAFNSVVPGQAASTNVGDAAPPPIPRFTIQSGSKQINISQVSAQLDLDFSEKPFSVSVGLPIVRKNLLKFWDGVCRLIQMSEIREAGAVLTVLTPSKKTMAENGSQIFSRYSKLPRWGEIASAAFNFGFLNAEKRLYNNLSIGLYETKSIKMESSFPGAQIFMDLSQAPIEESGFETKFDVNTKPHAIGKIALSAATGELMLDEIDEMVTNRGAEFLAW